MEFKEPKDLENFLQNKLGISTNVSTRGSQIILDDENALKALIGKKLDALSNENMSEAKLCTELLSKYSVYNYQKYYTPEQFSQEFIMSKNLLENLGHQLALSYNLDTDAQYELVEKCEDFIKTEESIVTDSFIIVVKQHRKNLPPRENINKSKDKDDDFIKKIFGDEKEISTENPEEITQGSTEQETSSYEQPSLDDDEFDPFIEEPATFEADFSESSFDPFKEDFSEDEHDIFNESSETAPSQDNIEENSHEEVDISNPNTNRQLSEDYLKRINFIKSKYSNLTKAPRSIAEEIKTLQQIRANLKLGQIDEYNANLAKLDTIDNSKFLNSASSKPVKIGNFENAYNKTKENLQKLWNNLKNFVVSKTQDLFKDNDKENR
ncbi:MAG: hypothetical protein HFJ45_05255 [Clostridia bacterium]|nr:hypothetical protein [Clostridia bacterium]